ncbi:MAG: GNAT family N-acetyltransferase [Endozoicomonas sp.]
MELIVTDYSNTDHATDIVELLNEYATDPMGGGEPLPEFAKENLALELSKLPHAFSVLCYVDGQPAGLANCFEAFSTFDCKPLINIHDLVVRSNFRGRGISQRLLNKIEETARDKGCGKVTLEVLEGNKTAQKAYLKYGFEPYQLDSEHGNALFWKKDLTGA